MLVHTAFILQFKPAKAYLDAGPANDTYATVNNTADAEALDVQNAGLYILGGNSPTELVVDSESPEVASRRLFFPFLFFIVPSLFFSGSNPFLFL